MNRTLTLLTALIVALSVPALAASLELVNTPATGGPGKFAAEEIRREAAAKGMTLGDDATATRIVLTVEKEGNAAAQSYSIRVQNEGGRRVITVRGADAAGAMYGGLDIAEAIRTGTLDSLKDSDHTPHIARRGIKFNIPLDLRTPSYTDCSDAAQANIPEMWEREFWTAFLDAMARHRYNVLSLWSLHPFPSLVKVPEFPEVALDDVWRTRAKLDDTFSFAGNDMVRPDMLADHEVVKRMTIDEKIEFWRWVMQHAADRGIQVYFFTWNVFTCGAEGKHGITNDLGNEITKKYFRASVREMVKTYPLLAGMGITAGEGMPQKMDSKAKEAWLWDTYGEGVRDALKDDPKREFGMIHRFHWTAQGDILDAFKDYPGPFEFSFKYSVAHMYSIPKPPFIQPLLENLAPGRKTWLTVRNDDIYTFRFGDPAYAREYILNMPPADKMAGFYMGPDGYVWGRDFLERHPDPGPRPLVMEKQWYSFMLWGRLAYDPSLPDSHFERSSPGRPPSQGFVTASLPRSSRRVAGHAADHALLLGGHRSQVVSRGLLEPSRGARASTPCAISWKASPCRARRCCASATGARASPPASRWSRPHRSKSPMPSTARRRKPSPRSTRSAKLPRKTPNSGRPSTTARRWPGWAATMRPRFAERVRWPCLT